MTISAHELNTMEFSAIVEIANTPPATLADARDSATARGYFDCVPGNVIDTQAAHSFAYERRTGYEDFSGDEIAAIVAAYRTGYDIAGQNWVNVDL